MLESLYKFLDFQFFKLLYKVNPDKAIKSLHQEAYSLDPIIPIDSKGARSFDRRLNELLAGKRNKL